VPEVRDHLLELRGLVLVVAARREDVLGAWWLLCDGSGSPEGPPVAWLP
jgi:hypothetical protein